MFNDVEEGYNLTSVAQAEATIDSINQDPFDRQILEMFATKLAPCSGLLCDLGCGPSRISVWVRSWTYSGKPAVSLSKTKGIGDRA